MLLTEVASRLYHYGQVLYGGSKDRYVCVCVCLIYNCERMCFKETACQLCGLITISSLYDSANDLSDYISKIKDGLQKRKSDMRKGNTLDIL